MDNLAPVIEAIGSLSDKTEEGRWQIAEAIYSAFEELPHHTQGLLQGLCTRLKYTSTNIYNYQKAWSLSEEFMNTEFGYWPVLSVSHYARMFDLAKVYGLSSPQKMEYLRMAEDENLSVRQLAQEVAGNHEPDPDEAYKRKFKRFTKLMRSLWNDPQFGNVNDMVRANYYDLMQELEKI
jgi:hypothetical protein